VLTWGESGALQGAITGYARLPHGPVCMEGRRRGGGAGPGLGLKNAGGPLGPTPAPAISDVTGHHHTI
jgi:hypothetical protein